MKWKLSRGKFRPQLLKLAESNSASQVEKLTLEGFKAVDSKKGSPLENIKLGIGHLTEMRGIGPATASAILTAGSPDKVAFMADEATYAILDTTTLKYSLSEYMCFMNAVRDTVIKLRKDDAQFDWTPHKVELTLWTYRLGLNMDFRFGLKNCVQQDLPIRSQNKSVTDETESEHTSESVYLSTQSGRKRKKTK
ncbi:hypothetical protein LSH36_32g05074 [Paralvinella palmiformis]|uniref:Uncharacterized protein n=1 Tax=Paralvinella palmiformis TaxID=53620 RepID=A0AAD9NE76_9ANNE|nr:hypothetical protein LSH36_32g05074 [Paralvinella palmiformis]